MTEDQIKHMVDRFLMWKLPEHFNPDAGISFTPIFNHHAPGGPQKHQPVGTNLFDATQADAMVRHMVAGMPEADRPFFECPGCGKDIAADPGGPHAAGCTRDPQ